MAKEMNCDKKKNYMMLYNGHKSDRHESRTGFFIGRHIMNIVLKLSPCSKCKLFLFG